MWSPPLYDRRFEHDACGVGFVASRDLQPSYRLTKLAVECLVRLEHRGAIAADGTGDGCGILTQVPYRLLARELSVRGIDPPPPGQLGVLSLFLDSKASEASKEIIAQSVAAEGLALLVFRPVPIHPGVLSRRALELLPVIEQALVSAPAEVSGIELERKLFLARKRAERLLSPGNSIISSSARTVVYKGLFLPRNIADFYWDLADVDFETSFAMFHQRYSTNTFPSWEIAQPFRSLAHNGEINTIASNRSWSKAREGVATSTIWGDRLSDVIPFLQPDSSDSGSLDNLFELLLLSGRSLGPRQGVAGAGGVGERRRPVARATSLLRVPRLSHRTVGRPGRRGGNRRNQPRRLRGPQRTPARSLDHHSQRCAGGLRGGGVPGRGSPGRADRSTRSGRDPPLRSEQAGSFSMRRSRTPWPPRPPTTSGSAPRPSTSSILSTRSPTTGSMPLPSVVCLVTPRRSAD